MPVWPAAGLALAVLLTYGKRVIPGLFLGILSIPIYAFVDFSTVNTIKNSLLTGISRSIGYCLQAVVGQCH
jgi:hypothetical protein